MTPICISPADRDLLYNRILAHLSGIDAVWRAATHRDYKTANRLGHEFCDELQLVMDDLGWGEHADEPVELTSPPELVTRVLEHLRSMAEAEDAHERKDGETLRDVEQENARLRLVCDQLLEAIAPRPAGSGAENA